MNPQKYENKIVLKSSHRIIIVVFIPNDNDYYKNIFEVFKLCLTSVQNTINDFAKITIVNNGCHESITRYINKEHFNDRIDCVIHHSVNIGKMDALIGAARGSREPLITLTDVDILFESGWQKAVEKLFHKIPQTGSVSPISVRTCLHYGTSSTLKDILLRKILFKWTPLPNNFYSHNRFLASFGQSVDLNDQVKWPVIEVNKTKALLGSSHQVMTVRRSILFSTVPEAPSLTLVGNNSEENYIDNPVNRAGFYRLSTAKNFAHHMGNQTEKWMYDIQKKNIETEVDYKSKFILKGKSKKINNVVFNLRNRIYIKLFKIFYKSEEYKKNK
ncbi:MAG: glycosyltransferase family 2 protein [Nonlabens sp.]